LRFLKIMTRILINVMLLLIIASLILTIVYLVKVTFPSLDVKGWDILAFMGSIIGGIITFFGVKYTIKRDDTQKILNDYPIKTRRLDNLTRKIKDELLQELDRENFDKIKLCISELMDEASLIDGEVYVHVLVIERHFLELFLPKLHYETDELGQMILVKDVEFKQSLYEFKTIVNLSLNFFKAHRERLSNIYWNKYKKFIGVTPKN